MQAKTNGKQFLWVLLLAFALITLCIGGLWAYVQSADAETGITETTLAEVPEASEIAYTPEKYDSFPAGTFELEKRFNPIQGCGLNEREILRFPKLLEAYAQGKGQNRRGLPCQEKMALPSSRLIPRHSAV